MSYVKIAVVCLIVAIFILLNRIFFGAKWKQTTIPELLSTVSPDHHGTRELIFTVNQSIPHDDVLGSGIMKIKVSTWDDAWDDGIMKMVSGIYVFFEPTGGGSRIFDEDVMIMSYHEKNGLPDDTLNKNTTKINIFQNGDKIRVEGCTEDIFSSKMAFRSYYTSLNTLLPREPDPDEENIYFQSKC